MRRLSVTIFLSLLASLLLVGAAVAFFWQWRLDSRTEAQESRFTELLAAEVVPAATEGVGRLQETLSRWHRRLRVDLEGVGARGRVRAGAGRPFRADGWWAPGGQVLRQRRDGHGRCIRDSFPGNDRYARNSHTRNSRARNRRARNAHIRQSRETGCHRLRHRRRCRWNRGLGTTETSRVGVAAA